MSEDLFNLVTDESIFTPDQFPQFYNDNQSLFVIFLQLYYKWLGLEGNINQQSKSIMSNRDIDLTLPQFVDHFKKKYAPGIPSQTFSDLDVRQLIKLMDRIISEKGSTGAIKFVLQAALGIDSDIYFPGRDVLKPSQSAWNQIRYLELSYSKTNKNLVGSMIRGQQSGAVAYVSDYQEFAINHRLICSLEFTNSVGIFQLGEMVINSDIVQDPIPHVVGSLSNITIYQGGLSFKVGEEIAVNHDPNDLGSGSVAIVSGTTPKNGVVAFSIRTGGFGYANSTTDPTNFMGQSINLTQSVTNPGAGAGFEIGTLSNTVSVTLSNDFISNYTSMALDATGYGFPEMPSANLATPIDNALNIKTIEVGTIQSLSAVNPGSGYNGSVNVSIDSKTYVGLNIVDSNGVLEGSDAVVLGLASQGQGSITTVSVKNSGYGYVSGEHVSLSTTENPGEYANGIVVIGSVGQEEGYWSDTTSFLDYPKYIQDSDYYQQFSYQINSPLDPDMYNDFVKPFHVSGTKRFAGVLLDGDANLGLPILSETLSLLPSTASSTQFMIGDGVANTGHLVDSNGRRIVAAPTVTAMHQTDWQGRVALSSQPRTNWVQASAITNNAPANLSLTTGASDPAGGTSGVLITVNVAPAQGQSGCGVYAYPTGAYPTSGTVNASVWIKASRAGIKLTFLMNSTQAAQTLFVTTGEWQLVTNDGPAKTNNAVNLYGNSFSTGSAVLAAGDTLTVAFIGEYSGASAPVIPAPSAPVTVTDYSVDSNGNVTLGQASAVGATLDWDGAGYVDQSGNFTQVPVTVANAQFMTGDGTSNTANLLDGSGNIVIDPTVTAVRQTDWQGTTTLSSTPRTNYVPASNFTNRNASLMSSTGGVQDPAGGTAAITMTALVAQDSSNAGNMGFYAFASGQPTSGSARWGAWVKGSRAGMSLNCSINTDGVTILTTGAWQFVTGTGIFESSLAVGIEADANATGSAAFAVGDSFTTAFFGIYSGAATPAIPTTTAPVTVTDYAPNPNFKNQLLLGQTPSPGATLNWDGSGYIMQPD